MGVGAKMMKCEDCKYYQRTEKLYRYNDYPGMKTFIYCERTKC